MNRLTYIIFLWFMATISNANAFDFNKGVDPKAQFNLGVMYLNGKSVIQSSGEAAKWFQKAAEQGHAEAQFNLGTMYECEAIILTIWKSLVTMKRPLGGI